jgi:choline transport protein
MVPTEVFTDFQSSSGWSIGSAYLISQVTVMYCNLGSDSVVHISEEVQDASLIVPKCMYVLLCAESLEKLFANSARWYSYVGNVILGIAMLITMLFCLGPLDGVVSFSCHPHSQFSSLTSL